MKSYQEFFAELKRRKVFKVAGVYGIVSSRAFTGLCRSG